MGYDIVCHVTIDVRNICMLNVLLVYVGQVVRADGGAQGGVPAKGAAGYLPSSPTLGRVATRWEPRSRSLLKRRRTNDNIHP